MLFEIILKQHATKNNNRNAVPVMKKVLDSVSPEGGPYISHLQAGANAYGFGRGTVPEGFWRVMKINSK